MFAVGCGEQPAATGAPGETCIADSIGGIKPVLRLPQCNPEDWGCRLKCRVGDAGNCLAVGYSLDRQSRSAEARQFYQRACLQGAANGCTNYGASIWVGKFTIEQLVCAGRIFEKACTAREPFACGMVGRIMIESTKPPRYAEARTRLERSCTQVGGFPCRVLARHLESGKLGDFPPDTVQTLLKRACDTGDPDACGQHPTAAETFK